MQDSATSCSCNQVFAKPCPTQRRLSNQCSSFSKPNASEAAAIRRAFLSLPKQTEFQRIAFVAPAWHQLYAPTWYLTNVWESEPKMGEALAENPALGRAAKKRAMFLDEVEERPKSRTAI